MRMRSNGRTEIPGLLSTCFRSRFRSPGVTIQLTLWFFLYIWTKVLEMAIEYAGNSETFHEVIFRLPIVAEINDPLRSKI